MLHKNVKSILKKYATVIDISESKNQNPQQQQQQQSNEEQKNQRKDVDPSLISFNTIESIIKSCLYEHHDIPLVSSSNTPIRPTFGSSSSSRNATTTTSSGAESNNSPRPVMMVPASMRATTTSSSSASSSSPSSSSSQAHQSPHSIHSQNKVNVIVEQFIKVSPTQVLAIPNAILQSSVSSTFLGTRTIFGPNQRKQNQQQQQHGSHSVISIASTSPTSSRRTSNSYHFHTPSRPQSNSGSGSGSGSVPIIPSTPTASSSITAASNFSSYSSTKYSSDINSTDIPRLVSSTLSSLGLDIRGAVQSHIFFTGKASKIPGLQSKLLQDLRRHIAKTDQGATSPLYIAGTPSLGSWTGASVYLASLSWFFAQDENSNSNLNLNLNSGSGSGNHHRRRSSVANHSSFINNDSPALASASSTGLSGSIGSSSFSQSSVSNKSKLPGEINRDLYLLYGYHKLNPPFGLVV